MERELEYFGVRVNPLAFLVVLFVVVFLERERELIEKKGERANWVDVAGVSVGRLEKCDKMFCLLYGSVCVDSICVENWST